MSSQYGNDYELLIHKTNNKKVLIGILIITFIFLILGWSNEYITRSANIFAIYWTIKVCKNKKSDEYTQWFSYWTIYGILDILDLFLKKIYSILLYFKIGIFGMVLFTKY